MVQLVSLDRAPTEADRKAMTAIVAALNAELGTRNKKAVSDALHLDPAAATRILSGQRRLYPHEIAAIEKAWKLPLGTILRRAGLVEDPDNVREAIAGDRAIEPEMREPLLRFYDSLAQGPSATSRTARKTPRS